MTTTELPPLFAEFKADGEQEQHTGAMIALRPRQDHIDRLAVTDGEKPEELHTTILFLGKAADYGYDLRDRIIQAMRQVAQRHRQVTGKGFGVNMWNPDSDEPCIVLGVGGKELVDIRNDIVSALMGFDLLQVPEQHEPWVPHVTLQYTDDASKVEELTDLAGEIIYDAIRVAFGGIVDDIPLQPNVSTDDGYAGPNRYAAVPGNAAVIKNFRTPRLPVYPGVSLDEKVIRRVRTAAGARRFGQPVGSVIVGDGSSPLKHIETTDSEYGGYEKYKGPNGMSIYTRKEKGEYVGYDENDQVIGRAKDEESLLRTFDSIAESGIGKASENKKPQRGGPPYGFKEAESEYDGYQKFIAPDGTEVYRGEDDYKYYDANDKPLTNAVVSKMGRQKPIQNADTGRTVSPAEAGAAMRGTGSKSPVVHGWPGLKPAVSEYDGYDKYTLPNGTPVYRKRGGRKGWYDENDNPINPDRLWKMGGGSESKKPVVDPEDAEIEAENVSKPKPSIQATSPARSSTGSAADAPPAVGNVPPKEGGIRASLINPGASDDLDAVLDKLEGSKTPTQAMIAELRRVAMRQGDARNRRKLMLYAQQLAEAKTFQELVTMDPWLRAISLEVKLITPGGRVGSGASLASSPKKNWIERTPMGRLPKYIRIVANGIKGHSKSRRIALAVAAMKRWARGGDNVRPQVQAAAAKALAEWEALKAAA